MIDGGTTGLRAAASHRDVGESTAGTAAASRPRYSAQPITYGQNHPVACRIYVEGMFIAQSQEPAL